MKKYKLSEIAIIENGGTPSTEVDEYWNGDIPWITPFDLSKTNTKWIKRGNRNITKEGVKNSNAKIIPARSIMVSTRAPIGYIVLNKVEATTNQGMKSVIPNTELVDTEYLYYLLKTKVKEMNLRAGGTTFREISTNTFKGLEVYIPSIEEQKFISYQLATLDEKIETNNLLIPSLEEYSMLLFHKWFIDFNFPNENGEPYKDSGGEMVHFQGKTIPKYWKIVMLSDLVTFKNGINYSADKNEIPNSKIISVKHLTRNTILNEKMADDIYLNTCISEEYKIKKFDTIIARSASPGESAIALRDLDVYYSGFSIRVRPKEEVWKYITYFNTLILKKIITSHSDGTIIKNITQQSLSNFKVLEPTKDIIELFNQQIELILLKIESLKNETEALIEMKDMLINKLIK